MAYCSACPDSEPSSPGFGWRSNGSIRVIEDSVSGAISYRNEVGNYLRWKLDGTDYVPITTDNFATLVKDSDPDATYIITFLDQTSRPVTARGGP
ncbi:MAG: hypothetical protein KF760_07525 [Candidatus Eremiobacteraeota bacterium]|nr:hypothetical protein [Candidatus Eremiobacteraeota bacterium]MCW5869746.1 hypothetical protein [Candidatus Eremiobacteraeota bacterium]